MTFDQFELTREALNQQAAKISTTCWQLKSLGVTDEAVYKKLNDELNDNTKATTALRQLYELQGSKDNLTFIYKGKNYTVPITETHLYTKGGLIQLPNGDVIRVDMWIETMPPRISGFVECIYPILNTATIYTATEVK